MTIKSITSVLIGSSIPSVTFTLRYDSDRNAVGTEVITSGTTVTNTTTGTTITTFNNPIIPADKFIWLETTAKSGTVNELFVQFEY
jgi:hypothetical protein